MDLIPRLFVLSTTIDFTYLTTRFLPRNQMLGKRYQRSTAAIHMQSIPQSFLIPPISVMLFLALSRSLPRTIPRRTGSTKYCLVFYFHHDLSYTP